MKFGRKNRRENQKNALPVQTVPKDRQTGLDLFERFETGSRAERELYSSMREAVPIIDAALCKIVRLIGRFSVKTENAACKKIAEDFIKNVNTYNI